MSWLIASSASSGSSPGSSRRSSARTAVPGLTLTARRAAPAAGRVPLERAVTEQTQIGEDADRADVGGHAALHVARAPADHARARVDELERRGRPALLDRDDVDVTGEDESAFGRPVAEAGDQRAEAVE